MKYRFVINIFLYIIYKYDIDKFFFKIIYSFGLSYLDFSGNSMVSKIFLNSLFIIYINYH